MNARNVDNAQADGLGNAAYIICARDLLEKEIAALTRSVSLLSIKVFRFRLSNKIATNSKITLTLPLLQ